MKELHLTRNDFRMDWFSGKGAGGQHRNKHQNCCRITHIESGLVSTGQSSRSRTDNQRDAFNSLVPKILDHYGLSPSDAERNSSSNVVRTYHFERNEVTDGTVTQQVKTVMDGELDEFVINALQHGREQRETGRG